MSVDNLEGVVRPVGVTTIINSLYYGKYSWGRLHDFVKNGESAFTSINSDGVTGIKTGPLIIRTKDLKSPLPNINKTKVIDKMSAIITDQLRILNSENFVAGIASTTNSYYAWIGLPNPADFQSDWSENPPSPKILLVRRMIIGINDRP